MRPDDLMRITSLTVENFRGFPTARRRVPSEGDFQDLNILIGPNGSGKTTLLNALSWAFGYGGTTSQTFRERPGTGGDFRDRTRAFNIRVESTLSKESPVCLRCGSPGATPETDPRLAREDPDPAAILRNRVFSMGWPRRFTAPGHVTSAATLFDHEAFTGSRVKNRAAYEECWAAVQQRARDFFGLALEAKLAESVDAILDGDGHSLLDNSDGYAHVVYMMMEIEKRRWSTAFLIDEPDVFLHPGLQRQLMAYLRWHSTEHYRHQFFIAGHSPYLLDWAADPETTRWLRMMRTVEGAEVVDARTEGAGWDVLEALGHRPSDVLHPNGVIWVEGPSDRIYLMTWLDAYARSCGQPGIRWGLEAEIIPYGGACLANCSTEPPDPFWMRPEASTSVEHLLKLVRVNPNTVVVMDADLDVGEPAENDPMRLHKERVRDDLKDPIRQKGWIIARRTIEDYVRQTLIAWRIPESLRKVERARRYAERARSKPPREVVRDDDLWAEIADIFSLVGRWSGEDMAKGQHQRETTSSARA